MTPQPIHHLALPALGLCVVSAAVATAITLAVTEPNSTPSTNATHAAQILESRVARLEQEVLDLAKTVHDLASRRVAAGEANTDHAERTPAGSPAPAAELEGVRKRLESIEAQLQNVRANSDPRIALVTSRRNRTNNWTKDAIESVLAMRAKRYELDAGQLERMRQLEGKWIERDRVILAVWESGADFRMLDQAIRQDEDAYQAEFESILTEKQREQRQSEIAAHGRSFVAR